METIIGIALLLLFGGAVLLMKRSSGGSSSTPRNGPGPRGPGDGTNLN